MTRKLPTFMAACVAIAAASAGLGATAWAQEATALPTTDAVATPGQPAQTLAIGTFASAAVAPQRALPTRHLAGNAPASPPVARNKNDLNAGADALASAQCELQLENHFIASMSARAGLQRCALPPGDRQPLGSAL